MRLVFLALIAAGLLASPSRAENSFHCPDPGTILQFTDGTVLTFTTQDGLTCRARSNKGALIARFLGTIPAELEIEKHEGERLFPWRVGNQVDFVSAPTPVNASGDIAYMPKDAYFDESFKVLREEKVTTAAGTFDTVVVEWHRQIKGRWLGVWVTTYWFAPEVGFAVKITRETRQGAPNPNVTYELTSITMPGKGAAPVARAAPSAEPSASAPVNTASGSPATSSRRLVVVDTVNLDQAGSMFLVPAEVNGRMTLTFILDSGASDLAIPADVVQTLKNSGTLSTADFIGSKTYVLADGSKLPSDAFIVHQLRVGNRVLKDVTAHVTPVQGRPLLGQSFLSQVSAWTIDNKQHVLIIMGDPAEAGAQAATPVLSTPSQAPAAPPPQVSAAPTPKPVPAPPPPPSAAPAPTAPPPATSVAAPIPAIEVASAATTAGASSFHCPRPGTVIEYSNGTKLKFGGENSFRCAYLDQNFREAEKFAGFADDAKFLDAGLDKLWPLATGKEQMVSVSMSGAFLTDRFTVLRSETVATPAGTFDTFVVEQEESGAGSQRAKRLFWYAPELGLIVKSTFNLLRSADRNAFAGTSPTGLMPGDYQAVRVDTPAGKPQQ